jgi:O-antigen/teichoic acid export membrane protein
LSSVLDTPADPAPTATGTRWWLRLGGFSILDQGLYAGTSFVVSIMLARWLTPGQFGLFAIAFALLALFVTLHASAITEPLGVFGVRAYRESFRSYFAFLLVVQAALSLGAALLVAVAGAIFELDGHHALAHALYALAAALPAVLLLWYVRRAFYARFAQHWSALGGAAYAALVLPSIVALHRAGELSPAVALLTLGGAALLVALGLLALLITHLPARAGGVWAPRAALADHVRYAKWALVASVTIWVSGYIEYLVLGVIGFRQAGAMRALDTILLPYWQYLTALASLLLPAFALRLEGSPAETRSFLRRVFTVSLVQALIVAAVILVAGQELMGLLFGSKYERYEHLMPVLGLVVIPETLAALLLALWRAEVRTRLVFVFSLVFSVTLLAAAVVGAHWGVAGVVVARVIVSYVVIAAFLVFGARRWTRT